MQGHHMAYSSASDVKSFAFCYCSRIVHAVILFVASLDSLVVLSLPWARVRRTIVCKQHRSIKWQAGKVVEVLRLRLLVRRSLVAREEFLRPLLR